VTREQLIHLLTEAAEVEHNLLCCYLYASFSLRRGAAEGLSESEDRAVSGWRKAVRGVAVEEMSHLAIINNLLVAVGGDCHFQRPNLPARPGYQPAAFNLRLTRFDADTLDHFIFLERPEESGVREPGRFRRHTPARSAQSGRDWITPTARDYSTIGEFYRDIEDGVGAFAAAYGPRAFVSPERQLDGAQIGMREVAVIGDEAAAREALQRVVEQGEGSRADSPDCHFARFRAMRGEWARLRVANPAFDPAHPVASDPVMRKPVDPASRTWITSAETVPWLDLGNAVYGVLLSLLVRLYRPSDEGERKRVAGAAFKAMHALGALGEKVARLPAGDDPSINAGLTFTVPRNIGGRATPALLGERLEELAREYDSLDGGNPLREAARLLL